MKNAVNLKPASLARGQVTIPRLVFNTWGTKNGETIARFFFPAGSEEPIPPGALILMPVKEGEQND
jgi:hypothetical protein